MFRIGLRTVMLLSCAGLTFSLWVSTADALSTSEGLERRQELSLLYTRLLRNIEAEAVHYSEYTDYRTALRLSDFWGQLERINLSRDEIIDRIAGVEKTKTETGFEKEFTLALSFHLPGPALLSKTFSNWRPFYILISAGFLFMIFGLFLFSCGVTCRRNIFSAIRQAFQGPPVEESFGPGERKQTEVVHRKAA